MSDDTLLFEGLKVLDVGSWIAGPVAATMLADRGADVLKVELPELGDGLRRFSLGPTSPDADVNYTWAQDGRNKRSLALNLKTPEGMDILKRLIEDCDVYLTNHPLPLRRKLGLMYEDIKALNKKLIYASLTAYGEQGTDRDKEAFDMIAYWNHSGMMNHIRPAGQSPLQALPGMGDHATAVAVYAGIVTALLKRERTSEGSFVHTSLLASGIWSASCLSQASFANADFSPMEKHRINYVIHKTLDGRWIQLNMVRNHDEFDAMLIAMEAFDILGDERFSTLESRAENAEAFSAALGEIFATKTLDEWLRLLRDENGVQIEKVTTFDELVDDENLKINRIVSPPVEEIGMEFVVNDPVNVEGVKRIGAKRAPEIGQHSVEVLTEMGFDQAAIDSFRGKGVI